jgi:hypothetical protein
MFTLRSIKYFKFIICLLCNIFKKKMNSIGVFVYRFKKKKYLINFFKHLNIQKTDWKFIKLNEFENIFVIKKNLRIKIYY